MNSTRPADRGIDLIALCRSEFKNQFWVDVFNAWSELNNKY